VKESKRPVGRLAYVRRQSVRLHFCRAAKLASGWMRVASMRCQEALLLRISRDFAEKLGEIDSID